MGSPVFDFYEIHTHTPSSETLMGVEDFYRAGSLLRSLKLLHTTYICAVWPLTTNYVRC